jgi:hypothetical protein
MKKIARQTFTFSIVFTMIFSIFFSLEDFALKSNAIACSMLTYNSEGNYYEIWDSDDLETMACRVNSTYSQVVSEPILVDNEASYKLMADIDMSGVTHWVPIGTTFSPFSGKFDGNGFTISNLKITKTTTYHELWQGWLDIHSVGFFGNVRNGDIENITLDHFIINVQSIEETSSSIGVGNMIFVGVLASVLDNAMVDSVTISNASIEMNQFISDSGYDVLMIGGLTGYSSSVNVENQDLQVDIHLGEANDSARLMHAYIGGMIGNALETHVRQSSFEGAINSQLMTKDEKYVGGMVGFFNDGSLTFNEVKDTVITVTSKESELFVGGLSGRSVNGDFLSSHFTGVIDVYETYFSYVGGISGGLNNESSIQQSYSEGLINVEAQYFIIGGVIGRAQTWGLRSIDQNENNQPKDIYLNNVYSTMDISMTEYHQVDVKAIQKGDMRYIGGLAGLIFSEAPLIQYGYFAGAITLDFLSEHYQENNILVDALFNHAEFSLRSDSSPFNDLYYDDNLLDESISSVNGEPKSTLEMKTQSTFTNFDFESIWVRTDAYNDGYPTFRWGRYLVQFVPNNDTVISDQLTLRAVAPTDPVKDDYAFIGWRLPSATENYVFNVLLNQDIVLTASYLSDILHLVEGTPLLSPSAKGLETAISYTDQERGERTLSKLILTLIEQIDADEEAFVDAYLASLEKKYKNVLYLDISLFKIVGDVQTKVTKANNMIEISFVLPEAYRTDPFVFLHIKDGKVEAVDFEYDEETFVITFEAEDFSSFVLAAEDAVEDDIPDTSDRSNSFAWWLMLLGLMLVLLTSKKRQLN